MDNKGSGALNMAGDKNGYEVEKAEFMREAAAAFDRMMKEDQEQVVRATRRPCCGKSSARADGMPLRRPRTISMNWRRKKSARNTYCA